MNDIALCNELEEAQLILPTIEPEPLPPQPAQELTPQDQLIEALDSLIRAKLEAIVENSDYIHGVVEDVFERSFARHLTLALENSQDAIDAVSEIAKGELENYDPTEAYGFERAVEAVVFGMDLSSTISRVIRDELSFTVEVN